MTEALAIALASGTFPSADFIHWLHQEVRAGREPEETKGCDAVAWAKYARQTRRTAVVTFGTLFGCKVDWDRDGHRTLYAHYCAGAYARRRLTPDQVEELKATPRRKWPRKLRRFVRFIQEGYRFWHLGITAAAAEGADAAEAERELEERFGGSSREDRLRFWVMARTMVLCWVVTGSWPSQLLRRARGGNLQALGELLRVDRRLLFDRGIQRQLSREMWNVKSAFVRTALRSVKSKLPPMKRSALKARLAAMAQVVAADSPVFDGPNVRQMFDAVAVAESKGAVRIDTDLPPAPEALRKAIWRERQWVGDKLRAATGQK